MGQSRATKDRLSNEDIQQKNRESQERINQMNLDFQREKFDYDKALQQQLFEREDSAYQRTVQDMRAAGISPLAMQGTNGAGEAVATVAPDAGQAYREEGLFNRSESLMNALGAINQTVDTLRNVSLLPSQISKANAETAATKQRTSQSEQLFPYIYSQQSYAADTAKWKNSAAIADMYIKSYEEADSRRRHEYDQFFGLNSHMTPDERRNAIASRFILGDSPYTDNNKSAWTFYDLDGTPMRTIEQGSANPKYMKGFSAIDFSSRLGSKIADYGMDLLDDYLKFKNKSPKSKGGK